MTRPTWPRALLALTLVAAAPFVRITQANAGAGVSATSGYDGANVELGSTVTTVVEIRNLNTPPDDALSIDSIQFIPSCGTTGPILDDCPPGSEDPGVLVAQQAHGVGGSSCEGVDFAVATTNSATGRVSLSPTDPVVLAAPDATCAIAITLAAKALPTIDSRPITAGLQTDGFATAIATTAGGVEAVASGGGFLTITPAVTSVATQVVDDSVPLGEPVADTATLTGGADHTGELTFDLYGPDDDDCSGPPAASTTQPVDGAGPYTSASALPDEPGTYRYVARYSGDDANLPATGACDDPNELVVVTAAEPPGIRVRNDASPLSRPEPGGTFAFDVEVTNTSAVPLTITGLVDDVYGDLSTQGTCTSAIGTRLAPGDAHRCAFAGDLTGNAGTTQTDVVTGTAVDDAGTQVTDDDDATISLTDVPPTVTVDKTPLPAEQPAPGGLFTFGLTITNTSAEPVTITSLVDDSYGDLAQLTSSSCAALVGATLAPGEARTCTFTGDLTGEPGTTHTNVVTVTVTDDEGTTGTAQDDATIRLVEPGQAPPSSTTTTAPAPSSSTPSTAPPTTPPAARPPATRLASTGDRTRTLAAQGLLLAGAGLALTGFGRSRPPRRAR